MGKPTDLWTLVLQLCFQSSSLQRETQNHTEFQRTAITTHLNEVAEGLLAGRTGEAAVHRMHLHVILQQLQPFERLRTQEAGVGAALRVRQKVVLQRRIAHEALAAEVAGEGVGVATVDPQVQVQLVFVPEGLAAQRAFERTETLPDEKVLQSCVLGLQRKERDQLQRP